MSSYEETYTLEERYQHCRQQIKELAADLVLTKTRLARVLGPQRCPKCNCILKFFPGPSVADPEHIIMYICPKRTGPGEHFFPHFYISDFTEDMVGFDEVLPQLPYKVTRIEV